jgi:DNA/RNA-binding domain of Phe-tRNA-synthetase-like protein
MNIYKTPDFEKKFPELSFGAAIIEDCKYSEKHSAEFKSYKRQILERLRNDYLGIYHSISCFDKFFQLWGFSCPLPNHLKKTIDQGFPNRNIFIDTHIVAEMTNGILMGIQDYRKFVGEIQIDVAKEGEKFAGISTTIFCKEGEIILRDSEDIVASLLQGPDKRTLVGQETTDVVIYAFMVPGIEKMLLEQSLKQSVEILDKYASAQKSTIQII